MRWNEKLKIRREAKKWSIEKAASVCNVSYGAFWKWEKGRSEPNLASQMTLCKVFGFDKNEFNGEVGIEADTTKNIGEKVVISLDYTTAQEIFEQLSKQISDMKICS